jgi:hypothetical protein
MSIVAQIEALFQALTKEELDALPPAIRRRFSLACQHWHEQSEASGRRVQEQGGVLALLKRGDRAG